MAALLVAACLEGTSARPLGAACHDDGGCEGDLVCLYGRCRSPCVLDRDCPEGTVCVASAEDPSVRACTAEDEGGCSDEVACPEGLVCGPDGLCREPCAEGTCGDGRLCIRGTCVEGARQVATLGDEADDGEIMAGEFRPDGEHDSVLYIGFWSGTFTWGYFRLGLAEPLPEGSRVWSVRLRLSGLGECEMESCGGDPTLCEPWTRRDRRLLVVAEGDPAPAQVASPDDVPGGAAGRAATATSVPWPVDEVWPDGEGAISPDLSPILQELVDDHGGLDADASVLLWIRGEGYEECAEVAIADSTHPSAEPAALEVLWSPPR